MKGLRVLLALCGVFFTVQAGIIEELKKEIEETKNKTAIIKSENEEITRVIRNLTEQCVDQIQHWRANKTELKEEIEKGMHELLGFYRAISEANSTKMALEKEVAKYSSLEEELKFVLKLIQQDLKELERHRLDGDDVTCAKFLKNKILLTAASGDNETIEVLLRELDQARAELEEQEDLRVELELTLEQTKEWCKQTLYDLETIVTELLGNEKELYKSINKFRMELEELLKTIKELEQKLEDLKKDIEKLRKAIKELWNIHKQYLKDIKCYKDLIARDVPPVPPVPPVV